MNVEHKLVIEANEKWKAHLSDLAQRKRKGGIIDKLTLPVDIRIAIAIAPGLGQNPGDVKEA